jgi:2-polyprenyl-3-methyl-5-hydroxy-6-metoxy-1,4-benzoquinol methylase
MRIVVADLQTKLYAEKTDEYFSRARIEIAPLLPNPPQLPLRALEIGCSEGHTLEWLKKTGYCNWTAGVEPYAELRTGPGAVDQFFKIDIEKALPDLPAGSIDLMLCLDVLEHLVNPWETIRRLDHFLKPGGILIISVPNIRNYHILVDLTFKGKFDYSESGILDRTHLRFFTRSTAIELAESAGAKVTKQIGTETNRWQKRLLSACGLGDILAKQFILAAQKPAP